MATWTLLPACVLVLMTLASCAGTGEVVDLHLQAGHPEFGENTNAADGLTVAVTTFEDLRSASGRLGSWTNFWGRERLFQVANGSPGEVTAQIMVDILNGAGWHAELVKPAQAELDADVRLSGSIQTLSVDAIGAFGSTEIAVKSQILVEASNRTDGSTLRMTLSGARTQEVFWFEPEDAQELVTRELTESLAKLVSNTKVEQKTLRVK